MRARSCKVFVQLYREGLIYKDKRLVNWDPKLETAISDLEVVQVEMKGHLWHFKYPIVDDDGQETGEFIIVATTRPETMLGDTGVAVHPEDERYKHLHGKKVRLPLVGRLIPIVADEYSDPEKGTGAVKITPAHDFNDFEVGQRHGLPLVNIFDAEARVCTLRRKRRVSRRRAAEPTISTKCSASTGSIALGARATIVAMMDDARPARRDRAASHTVPHGDRSDAVIEPWLTDQWYVDAKTLAAAGARRRARGQDQFRAEELGEDLFRVAGEYPALVHLAPALVGPSDSGVVRQRDGEMSSSRDRGRSAIRWRSALPGDRDGVRR